MNTHTCYGTKTRCHKLSVYFIGPFLGTWVTQSVLKHLLFWDECSKFFSSQPSNFELHILSFFWFFTFGYGTCLLVISICRTFIPLFWSDTKHVSSVVMLNEDWFWCHMHITSEASTFHINSRLHLFHCASMPHKITSRASCLVGASCRRISVCAPSAQSACTNSLSN